MFSGHKLYGPTGIGILYVKEALLQEMPPWEGGGSMIATVSLSEGTTWTKAPWRFEAGTPNTGGIIGLGAALEYVSALGLNNIAEYEQNLMHYALSQLAAVPDLTLYGPPDRLGVIALISVNTTPMMLAVFSIITALLCVPDITAQCH